jgi:hypothetical protein
LPFRAAKDFFKTWVEEEQVGAVGAAPAQLAAAASSIAAAESWTAAL